mgnify:CR=1 FL=1
MGQPEMERAAEHVVAAWFVKQMAGWDAKAKEEASSISP